MTYQSQLQRNTGVLDPLVFSHDLEDSYWYYWGYKTCKNFFRYFTDVTQDKPGVTWGGTSSIQIPHTADKTGPWQLIFDVGPLTNADRFVDYLGYYAWEKIEFVYGTNEVYVLTPDECFLRAKQSFDIVPQEALKELVAGGKSQGQRSSLADTTQTLIVDLPFPHTRSTSRWMELIQMAVEPRLYIHWRPLRNIVQGITPNQTPTADLSNVKLRCTHVHLDGDERDDNTSRTEDVDGIIRLFEEMKAEKFTREFVSGTTGEVTVKLNNFRTATKSYTFLLRRVSDVAPGAGQEANYTNLAPVEKFYLTAADGKIHEPVEDRYYRFYLHPLNHHAPSGDYIYEWSFAMEPDDVLNCSGSLNLGNTSNLQLVITLPNALNADHELTVICREYNMVQHSRGDIAKNFK